MGNAKKAVSKQNLPKLLSLYAKQSWLIERDAELIELLNFCEDEARQKLIIELLGDFYFLEQRVLANYLNEIAEYIIEESKFDESKAQIASITYDNDPDSSQKVLDYIKIPLGKLGWGRVKMVNNFGASVKSFNKGFKQIIFIDEFIGSGQTILGRLDYLKKNTDGDVEIKLCFIAGMDYAIKLVEEQGYEIFCPLRLNRGISDKYRGEELANAIEIMNVLEGKLADTINSISLSPKYNFGYNQAEALYSLEGCNGNTPNSVFPIFWWSKTKSEDNRKTLLFRFEQKLL